MTAMTSGVALCQSNEDAQANTENKKEGETAGEATGAEK
jgi:hypothetical protein